MNTASTVEVRTANEFYETFKVRPENVKKIMGSMLPNYKLLKPIYNAVDDNLIGIRDERDQTYGKLWMIKDTSTMPNRPNNRIVATAHPGRAPYYAAANQMTQRDYENQMNTWRQDLEWNVTKHNVEEAIKLFLLVTIDYSYYAEHYHYKTKLNGVSVTTILNTIQVKKYPAEYKDK